MYIYFHISTNIELPKVLQVHIYIVSKTEKTHYYQLCRQNTKSVYTRLKKTTINYVDIIQSVHASFVDKTFHVYLN